MSVHDGHRKRMKDRYLKTAFDGMSEHEILELLLFYCIPRCDTNGFAHNLINRFGSLTNVFLAPITELQKVEGIGPNAAVFISLLGDTFKHMQIKKSQTKKHLRTYQDYGEYLINYFIGKQNEVVLLLCLDAKSSVIGCYQVGEGSVNSVNLFNRKIIETVISTKASAVVLAHNHPGGYAVASTEDKVLTIQLAQLLMSTDVDLLDHVIVADDSFLSMAQTGEYRIEDVLSMTFTE